MTCGTGSQVFWLMDQGFNVTGADINASMLKVAKEKAQGQKVSLIEGNMCTLKVGTFDAAITIFNAVGHLTKQDFEKAICNIHQNLNAGGLYIFDIFNLSYLQHRDNITKLTIDWLVEGVRKIQYSTIDHEGIMASFTTRLGEDKTLSEQTLQVYSARQLRIMLERNGFTIIEQTGADGVPFIEEKSERILTVAKKL